MRCIVHVLCFSLSPTLVSPSRLLQPRDSDRLIVLIKDINLPKPDNYGTVQIVSFLHQLLTYRGFYDEGLSFVRVERIQFVCTIALEKTRQRVSPRLINLMRTSVVEAMPKEELEIVLSMRLENELEAHDLGCLLVSTSSL